MRSEHTRPLHGSHHGAFLPEEKDALIRHVRDIASSCGDPIDRQELSFPGLKKDGYSHDCLCLESDQAKTYVEFPLRTCETTGTKVPAPDLHQAVLRYLRERIWTDLRERCLKVDDMSNAHQDGTLNTIWNERITVTKPHLQSGMSATQDELRITTELGSKSTLTVVHPDRITIPHRLPHAIVHGGLCRLGDIVDMPDCGDNDVQDRFLDQYVFSITPKGEGTVLETGSMKHPVMGDNGIYPWRAMRRLACVRVTPTGYDPLTYDVERDIAEYLRENREFFENHGVPEEHYERRIAA